MQLELNKQYFGFKLLEEKKIKELNSIAKIFIHEKSGAKLFKLENDDDNKVFSITFRTPPKDSTGVAHIIEHSVLCGSRKFPVKEPFVELVKGSLNTFLNAMTFSDKTMYPVASRNTKDFYNLIDVYMDAVLYPNIYKSPEILMQEGWHYELENSEDEITYKGVVYNEMKGAFSSPDSINSRKIQESLFPDTPYGVESGGDPDVIPELTYDAFKEFHSTYYHPSNSYIFLYGDGNTLEELQYLNDNYLSNFKTISIDSKIPAQKPFENQRNLTLEYPISNSEKEEDKTFLSLNFGVSNSTNSELYLSFDILEHLLLETSAAPLKKALIDANLGKDVFGSFDNSIFQPTFSIVVKNSNENEKDRFQKVVFDTLTKLVKDGIDKKLVEASINIKEFNLREADFGGYPKGLIYNISCMDSWLYDESPLIHLEYEPILEKIKSALTTNYFENLIEKYLLSNTHRSLLMLKPKKGLAEEKDEEVRKALANYKASLSKEQIEDLIAQTNKLKERQMSEDSPEDLEKIPMVSLKDIDPKAEVYSLEERKLDDIKVLFHQTFTNHIAYVSFYFDTSVVEKDLIPYVSLLSNILGKVSTKNYYYEDLSKEVNIHTGGISYANKTMTENGSDEVYYPKLVVKTKALVSKLPKLFELAGEIVGNTKFDDEKRLRDIICELKSRYERRILERGHSIAVSRLNSYFSPAGKYEDLISGISFYKFISEIEKNLDTKISDVITNLQKVKSSVFNKNNLIISVTTSEEDYIEFQNNLHTFNKYVGCDVLPALSYKFELAPLNEGLMTSAKVQYAAKAYNFKKLGYSYTGSLQVLNLIASYDYLWNKIRVQGGAYGVMNGYSRSGNMYLVSYRDPNLKETLTAYDEMCNYLKNFNTNSREMTKYIIGTISSLDSPLTPSMKGEHASDCYIRHISADDIQNERNEVLNTNVEVIRGFADLIGDSMKQNYTCVLGNEDKIKENKDLFNNLVNVFE